MGDAVQIRRAASCPRSPDCSTTDTDFDVPRLRHAGPGRPSRARPRGRRAASDEQMFLGAGPALGDAERTSGRSATRGDGRWAYARHSSRWSVELCAHVGARGRSGPSWKRSERRRAARRDEASAGLLCHPCTRSGPTNLVDMIFRSLLRDSGKRLQVPIVAPRVARLLRFPKKTDRERDGGNERRPARHCGARKLACYVCVYGGIELRMG